MEQKEELIRILLSYHENEDKQLLRKNLFELAFSIKPIQHPINDLIVKAISEHKDQSNWLHTLNEIAKTKCSTGDIDDGIPYISSPFDYRN